MRIGYPHTVGQKRLPPPAECRDRLDTSQVHVTKAVRRVSYLPWLPPFFCRRRCHDIQTDFPAIRGCHLLGGNVTLSSVRAFSSTGMPAAVLPLLHWLIASCTAAFMFRLLSNVRLRSASNWQ